jgi:hypothetical protein
MTHNRIKNDLSDIKLDDGDKIVIVVAKSMIILGAYTYVKELNEFHLDKIINKTTKYFYDKLPMITFVNERTYKLFAKKIREITKENYDAFLK